MYIKQLASGVMRIDIPIPHTGYIDNLVRKNCFSELWDLFRLATAPLKEMSESYSAYKHTRNFKKVDGVTVIHVGDGADCRTGAMFALMTKHNNISIDPIVNWSHVQQWQDAHSIERFSWFKGKWQDFNWEGYTGSKVILTFTHAHVNSWEICQYAISKGVIVLGAYVSGCCHPEYQLTLPVEKFDDWGILSPERTCQVWYNPNIDWSRG